MQTFDLAPLTLLFVSFEWMSLPLIEAQSADTKLRHNIGPSGNKHSYVVTK